jgi:hypothetical protein
MRSDSVAGIEALEDEQNLSLYIVQQDQCIRKDALPDLLDLVESFHPRGYGKATL